MDYETALANAAASAARLGAALGMFDRDIKELARLSPKCECGYAHGHNGACRHHQTDESTS